MGRKAPSGWAAAEAAWLEDVEVPVEKEEYRWRKGETHLEWTVRVHNARNTERENAKKAKAKAEEEERWKKRQEQMASEEIERSKKWAEERKKYIGMAPEQVRAAMRVESDAKTKQYFAEEAVADAARREKRRQARASLIKNAAKFESVEAMHETEDWRVAAVVGMTRADRYRFWKAWERARKRE